MGNGASSIVSATGGATASSQIGCLGGEQFQTKVGMLKETPLGKVLSEADLAYFSTFFSLEKLEAHCHVPMCAGELLVVGDGEVQVYVIQAGLDAKTREQRFVLCTKRKGDLIWVPTVNRLAKQKSASDESSITSSSGGGGGATGAGAGAEAHGSPPAVAPSKHKDLYTLLDTTYIDSLYGATLLKVSGFSFGPSPSTMCAHPPNDTMTDRLPFSPGGDPAGPPKIREPRGWEHGPGQPGGHHPTGPDGAPPRH